MLVKSLGRRGSFAVAKSLWYVTKEEKTLKNPDGSSVVFRHNIFGQNLSQVEQEYMQNEMKRLVHRSNNLKVMHTILAFSPLDNEKIDVNILQDLTRKYFELLNPNALYFATVHQDTDNFHVHIVVSPTDIMGNSIRISQEEFETLKIDLQEYQKATYPELAASIVEHGAEEKDYNKPDYWQKDGDIPKKEQLRQSLTAAFDLSHNRQEFLDLLHEDGLTTYERGGESVGITSERNYRFKTLGIDLTELDKREERLNELVEITEEKEPIIAINKDVTQDAVSNEEVTEEDLSEEELKRLNELDDLSER